MRFKPKTNGKLRTLTVAISWLTSLAIVSLVSFWYGVDQGWQLSIFSEAAPRGLVATGNLNALKAGKKDVVVFILESEVDNGLLYTDKLLRHPLLDYIEPVWGYPYNSEQAVKQITRLANFRKNHAFLYKEKTFSSSSDETREELNKESQQNAQIMQQMIERYATK